MLFQHSHAALTIQGCGRVFQSQFLNLPERSSWDVSWDGRPKKCQNTAEGRCVLKVFSRIPSSLFPKRYESFKRGRLGQSLQKNYAAVKILHFLTTIQSAERINGRKTIRESGSSKIRVGGVFLILEELLEHFDGFVEGEGGNRAQDEEFLTGSVGTKTVGAIGQALECAFSDPERSGFEIGGVTWEFRGRVRPDRRGGRNERAGWNCMGERRLCCARRAHQKSDGSGKNPRGEEEGYRALNRIHKIKNWNEFECVNKSR
jgi:hypothetical protein